MRQSTNVGKPSKCNDYPEREYAGDCGSARHLYKVMIQSALYRNIQLTQRLIFGGTEFAYASDPEFTETSDDPKFWKEVIDRTYSKYYGLSDWHNELVYIAMKTGLLTIPSGREYSFHPYTDKWNKLRWPRTNILNYPVQGFAADIMQLIRIHIYDVLEADKPEILFVNTIHDDIQFDIHPKHLDKVAKVVYNVYSKMQDIILSTYKFDFKVPLEVEVFYGPNLGDMTLYAN